MAPSTCALLKEEFTAKKLHLNLDDDRVLKESWILPLWALALLRSTMALFCVVTTIVFFSRTADPRSLIYLTIWSYLVLTLNFLCLSVMSVVHYVRGLKGNQREVVSGRRPSLNGETTDYTVAMNESERPDGNQNRIFQRQMFHGKFLWLLWVIASGGGLVVTLLYWTVVFRKRTSFLDIAFHAVNSFFILVEVLANSIPVRLLHGVYLVVYFVTYGIFTVIYWAAGGVSLQNTTYIYKVLDYEKGNPGLIVGTMLATVFVVIPLTQLLLFGLYQLRLFLRRKYIPRQDESENGVQDI